MAELTTRSVLGPNLLKTQRLIGRRLITSNEITVRRFNNIVKVRFEKCKIIERMETLITMSDKFEYPPPVWLRKAINGIHTEMDEIRKHANDNCRKILTPASPFGLEVKH